MSDYDGDCSRGGCPSRLLVGKKGVTVKCEIWFQLPILIVDPVVIGNFRVDLIGV